MKRQQQNRMLSFSLFLLLSGLYWNMHCVTAQEYVPGEVLVKFRSGVSDVAQAAVHAALGTQPQQMPVSGIQRCRLQEGESVRAAITRYQNNPLVEWAEPNIIYRLLLRPNDPYYNDPNLGSMAALQESYLSLMDVEPAWGAETGSSDIIIAIIDSGVDLDHPDLAANIWTNPGEIEGNGIDDDGNGYVDDLHGWDFVGADPGDFSQLDSEDNNPDVFLGDPSVGNGLDENGDGNADLGVMHGTMVAGVAAAVGNNGIGVAGACWDCQIMPLRAGNPEGTLVLSDAVAAIQYATDNGARVINLSFGASEQSQALQDAIDAAHAAGCVLIAASGNAGTSDPLYPAAYANTIAVGACQGTSQASFSSWGPHIDVVAPGVNIWGTYVYSMAEATVYQDFGIDIQAGDPDYGSESGTSFAAPLVAGLAALVLSKTHSLTPEQVRSAIRDGAQDLDTSENDWDGDGMVQFAATDSLPVTLSSFQAESTAEGVLLSWRTESEVDHAVFVLYREEPPGRRIPIRIFPGIGNSATPQEYAFTDADIIPGMTYTYFLEDRDLKGISHIRRSLRIRVPPAGVELLPPFPNPSNPEVWIPFRLPQPSRVEIRIHDLLGHPVRALDLGLLPAGAYETKGRAAHWDGRNTQGERSLSGLYFYTLYSTAPRQTRSFVLMR